MSLVSGVIARPVSQRNLLRSPLVIAAASCLAGAAAVLVLTTVTDRKLMSQAKPAAGGRFSRGG